MEVKNLKELQKVIQLCRKLGVEAIEVDNVKLNLGAIPSKIANNTRKVDQEVFPEESIKVPQFTPVQDAADKIATDELSEEQLMYYSSASKEAHESEYKDN